ncbi:TOLL8-like protein [Mya arenaria]|uniref:TOLL8-like protein n=1 Tax=Mya arenaria TaxID=6604 RepID=A0ABY7GC31_MYAAR|nr:toll-like receptor 2 [Mya arenaria]WAR30912.1 TOLL8-like protein [Mya arenaria]
MMVRLLLKSRWLLSNVIWIFMFKVSLGSNIKPTNTLVNYGDVDLPEQWRNLCKIHYEYMIGSNFTSRWSYRLSCDLGANDHWSLASYREWVSTKEVAKLQMTLPARANSSLNFALEIHCSSQNATVSLPWPARARYLWSIAINNCTLVDFLAEYNKTHSEADNLNVFIVTDSVTLTQNEQFLHVFENYKNMSSHYYCGGEQLEKLVKRNNQQKFEIPKRNTLVNLNRSPRLLSLKGDSESDGTHVKSSSRKTQFDRFGNGMRMPNVKKISAEQRTMLRKIAKFGQDYKVERRQCSFDRLRYIDESHSRSLSKHHTFFMTERSSYPSLMFYNLSHSKITQLSPMVLQWRRYFPKMMYLDMSYNRIKYFATLSDNGLLADGVGVLDLRHNNITTITYEDFEALGVHSNTVFVDLRHNPLHCDCKLKHLVEAVHNQTSDLMKQYSYLGEMQCATPERFQNTALSSLHADFCDVLDIIYHEGPIIALSCCVLGVAVLVILAIKYRRELMILAFTRLHISLPCRKVIKDGNKLYDAFIAYSEHDGAWVFNTLLPRLERPIENNGPGFKLCIHHRDFPVGGSIADNIVDKVRESNHTVLILSNEFLQSHWCKYEFKAAFTQSITEKKRHLIMVIKEELYKPLIDQELKRCLQTFTYVQTDDVLFWDKIIFALADRKRNIVNVEENNVINANVNNVAQNERDNVGQGHEVRDEERAPQQEMVNIGFIQDGNWVL